MIQTSRLPPDSAAGGSKIFSEVSDHLNIRTRLTLKLHFNLFELVGDDVEDTSRRDLSYLLEVKCVSR